MPGLQQKQGLYLRPRMVARSSIFEVGLAVVLGVVSGVYIFRDTMRHLPPPEQSPSGVADESS